MRIRIDRSYLLIATTMFAAMLLSALPIPEWAHPYWPEWTLLTMIYWCLAIPHRVNVKFAWTVGILVDLLKGSLLGHHALVYTLVAYLTAYLHQRLRFYPPHQQIVFIAGMMLIYALITMWIDGLRYAFQLHWQSLLTVATSMMVWPWVFAMLRHLRRRSYIHAQG